VDVLSDVLTVVRLSGAIFVDVDVTAPWYAHTPPTTDLKNALPGSRHLMSYHLVTAGEVWATPADGVPLRLPAGTMIIFPHGSAHVLGSDPALGPGTVIDTHNLPVALNRPYLIRGGGDGPDRCKLICGFFGCDGLPFNPLLASLPETIVLTMNDDQAGDLGVFFRLAVAEANAGAPGGAATLGRLGELMLIEALRRYMQNGRPEITGWIGGMRDPQLARAIEAVHARPLHPWKLELLAREAGMSRTSFSQRFHQLMEITPMEYVTSWRMQLAAACLASGGKIAAAAAQAGYESEASFARAFQKRTGVTPGKWRTKTVA